MLSYLGIPKRVSPIAPHPSRLPVILASMVGRPPRLLALGALILLAMSGCSVEPEGEEETYMCVSWSDLSDPQAAFDEADAVIIGRSSPASGVTRMFGVDAGVHEVEVLQVFKGEVAAVALIASTPETCTTGAPYPSGDPLDAQGDLLLFLTEPSDDTPWSTLTPFDGVRSAPGDGSLPFDANATSDS